MKKKVMSDDIKEMLGIEDELEAFEEIQRLNLEYREVGGQERDIYILGCIKRIESDTQIAGTPERTKVWEDGWQENLDLFTREYDTDMLKPKYFHSGLPIRFKGEFIKSELPNFQVDLDLFIKRCIFELYAKPYHNIYEFGCGTGYNLVMLSGMYPNKDLVGLDFTNSAIKILELLHNDLKLNIKGHRFDFTDPDTDYVIKTDSAVFTFAALEQIGSNFKSFIDYLITSKANMVVHMEPIVELYDEENLLDYLSHDFHKKRKYLEGFYPYLLEVEQEGQIKIEKVKRLHLGNHNHESYTIIAWRPML